MARATATEEEIWRLEHVAWRCGGERVAGVGELHVKQKGRTYRRQLGTNRYSSRVLAEA
jgi:hypothetical protein